MANIDFIEQQIKISVEKMRPPKDIRDQVDISYNYEKNTLEIFEIQPRWNDESQKTQTPIAKTKFIKSQGIWKIYWMRASGKWENYPPNREVKTIKEFFEILKKDEHACFWG